MRAVVLLLLLACAGAGESAAVRLRPQATVAATRAALADCAELVGDPALVARLAALPAIDLPDAEARTLDAGQVRALLARAGLAAAVEGSCRVSRRLRVVQAGDLIDAVRAAVPRNGDEVEIAVVRCSGPATVADGGAPPRLEAEPLSPPIAGEGAWRVRLMEGEREVGRGLVVVALRRQRMVAVAVRPLQRGQTVGAGDLRLAKVEIGPLTAAATSELPMLVGRVLRTDLAAGQPVLPGQVVEPPAVVGGQPVELVVRVGNAELCAPGAALGDGRVGQPVAVRRGDGKQVRGTVLGPGRVLLTAP